jgi:hypothetical protein
VNYIPKSTAISKHLILVPGTTVAAWVYPSKHAPGYWSYTLFDEDGKAFATDGVNFSGLDVDAQQVARIAFILEVDYGLNKVSERYGA